MKYILSFFNHHTSRQQGFAMLFTVLIVSIILSLAIGISNVTYKQNLLSSIAKDSQVAFSAADDGIECGMAYDLSATYFPRGFGPASIPTKSLSCGATNFTMDEANSSTSFIVFKQTVSDQTKPCKSIVFNKTDAVINKVQSRGYSMCQNTPRQVERALEVRY